MGTKEWILTAAVAILGSIIWYILQTIASRTLKRLDDILEELKKLTMMMDRHELELQNIQKTLKDHEDRIREIEKD